MNALHALPVVVGVVSALLSGSAIALTPPPLSVLFAEPDYKTAEISPDGKYTGVIFTLNGVDTLGVIDETQNKIVSTFGFRESGEAVGEFWWLKDNQLLLKPVKDVGWKEVPDWYGELFTAKVDGRNFRAIYGYRVGEMQAGSHMKKSTPTRGWGYLENDLADDPNEILVSSYDWTASGDATPELLRVDLRNATARKVVGSPAVNANFVVSPAGEVKYALAADKNNAVLVFRFDAESRDWIKVASNTARKGVMKPLGISSDGNVTYYLSDTDTGTDGLFASDLVSGETKPIYHHDSHNIRSVQFDPKTGEPLWVVHADDHSVAYLNTDHRLVKLRKMLDKAFNGSLLSFTSFTKDFSKALVYVVSDVDPGAWYSVDLESRKAKFELQRYAAIDPAELVPVKTISLKARDGLQLNGYYTSKPTAEGKKPPMVVLVHGGPHSVRDSWEFNPEVQALATRGFAVLQVNFRGSSGYGREFEVAGRGQWGRTMQDDVTDATQWAIAQGLADPARICIMGGSYGGYASLMGVIREPELYKCAIDMFGVTDLEMLYKDDEITDRRWGKAFLKDIIGSDPNEWYARSPARLAHKVQAPVLIIAGDEDTVVPMEHSKMMEKALRKEGKPVETLYFDKEGHGLANPVNRVKAYETILTFLDRHIGEKS